MKTFTPKEIQEVLRLHKLWLAGSPEGKCADLRNADLRNADLRNANLFGADLREANLRNANLRNANLFGADLRNADLRNADLRNAYLYGADLCGADLCDANLCNANLRRAYLSHAYLRSANLWGCVGNGSEIKSLQCGGYPVTYTAEVLQIGCQQHAINDWWQFNAEEIDEMDEKATEWWGVWRPLLESILAASPAIPVQVMPETEES